MSSEQFLRLTATTEWLTVSELVGRLRGAGYWQEASPPLTPSEQVRHVRQRLAGLRDAAGRPCFVSMVIHGADGAPRLLFKQARLLAQVSGRLSRDEARAAGGLKHGAGDAATRERAS